MLIGIDGQLPDTAPMSSDKNENYDAKRNTKRETEGFTASNGREYVRGRSRGIDLWGHGGGQRRNAAFSRRGE